MTCEGVCYLGLRSMGETEFSLESRNRLTQEQVYRSIQRQRRATIQFP